MILRYLLNYHLKTFYSLIIFISSLFMQNTYANWQILRPGLSYQHLDLPYLSPWSYVHVFRINLKHHKIALLNAKEIGLKHASIEQFAQESQALITMNGGFFDKNAHPLGLRMMHHQQTNPFKLISWWGVFYLKNQQAVIQSARHFHADKTIELAIESGPRLIINGRIPPLKSQKAERSAIGITKDQQIILLITEHYPLSTTQLAHLLQKSPLNCENALNLDGGSSSQVYARIPPYFKLNVYGFSRVSDALLIYEK
ncbi:MAG: hypothetical protein CMF38_01610 [Legionellaceae bacterium]|nr:hypothetical protein [Legionellaceae bacterium]HCA89741.1 hypothetical protein [Legionellales bacterium]